MYMTIPSHAHLPTLPAWLAAAGWKIAVAALIVCIAASQAVGKAPITPPEMTLQNGNINGLSWLAVSPDGQHLATLSPHYNSLDIWSIDSGLLLKHLPGIEGDKVTFTPDGKRLFIAGDYPITAHSVGLGHQYGFAAAERHGCGWFGQFTSDGTGYWD